MNHIQNLLSVAIIATLVLFAFGPPTQAQAEPSAVEPDQFSCANVTEIPQSECEALVALYNGTDGPSWTVQTDWLVTNTPCSWYGVTCYDSHVTRVDFNNGGSGNNLSGDIPPIIEDLTLLTFLDFSYNKLESVPAEIGNLTNLTVLNLAKNLSSLPAEIGNLTSLTWLSLYANQLSSLPAEIWTLTSLTVLDLAKNQLSSLPAEIGNLINLTELYLGKTRLNNLPAEIGKLTSLTLLYLEFNQLSNLPTEISKLTNLTTLSLSLNKLSSLPTEISNLTNLTTLSLLSNKLSSIPTEIWTLTSLTVLDLANNQLSSLPTEIGKLTNLTTLSLYNNQLSSLPTEIDKLINLTEFDLRYNQLDILPVGIGTLTSLTKLDLTANSLVSLPIEIINLTDLTELDLAYNRLAIPDDLDSFITERDEDWLDTQTVAPANIEATVLDDGSIQLTWTPITFNGLGGYYEISMSEGDTLTVHGKTVNKSDSGYLIEGLTGDKTYEIHIRTYTPAHDSQPQELWSDYSLIVLDTTLASGNPTGQAETNLFLPLIHN